MERAKSKEAGGGSAHQKGMEALDQCWAQARPAMGVKGQRNKLQSISCTPSERQTRGGMACKAFPKTKHGGESGMSTQQHLIFWDYLG
jgi:hypothetical protein